MKQYFFPRGEFHYSDWKSWRQSEKGYKKEWFHDEKSLDHLPAIKFGSHLMELLETNPEHKLVKDLPRFSHVEYELTCMLNGEIPINTHPDSCDVDNSLAVLEYKTALQKSSTRWTPRKVQKQQQITFYQMCLQEKFGDWNPDNNYIIEIPTQRKRTEVDENGVEWDIEEKERWREIVRARKEDGSYVRHIPHQRVVTQAEIDKLKEDVVAAAHEVSDSYEQHLDDVFENLII